MSRFPAILTVIAGFLSLGGCAQPPTSAKAMQSSSTTVSISNGVVDLTVDPKIGRITRYGYVGGPNILWTNTAADVSAGGWLNYGGEKLWLWPQDDWGPVYKQGWPPLMDVAPLNMYDVEAHGRTIVMRSRVIPKFNARIVREIKLGDTGTHVEIRSHVEALDGGPPRPIAAWSVTQVPMKGSIFVTRGSSPTTNPSSPQQDALLPQNISNADDRWYRVSAGAQSMKYFFAANALVAERPDGTRFHTTYASPQAAVKTIPRDRAQVYIEGTASAATAGRELYVELEFVGPLGSGENGVISELTTTWELEKDSSPR